MQKKKIGRLIGKSGNRKEKAKGAENRPKRRAGGEGVLELTGLGVQEKKIGKRRKKGPKEYEKIVRERKSGSGGRAPGRSFLREGEGQEDWKRGGAGDKSKSRGGNGDEQRKSGKLRAKSEIIMGGGIKNYIGGRSKGHVVSVMQDLEFEKLGKLP